MDVSSKVPKEVRKMMSLDDYNPCIRDSDVEENKYYFVTTEDNPHSISSVLEVTIITADFGDDIQALGSLFNLKDGGYDIDCKKDFSKKQIGNEVSRELYSSIIEFFKRQLDESKRNKTDDDKEMKCIELTSGCRKN